MSWTPPRDQEYYRDWQCQFCGDWKVVPGLARDCERRHDEETEKYLKSSA